MAMPIDFVMVRHGQSEANLVQKKLVECPDGFYDRHDSEMRLSNRGVEQAMAAGRWLLEHIPSGFNRYYTSPHIRAKETAGRLALNAGNVWIEDDRWREQDWGEFGILSDEERASDQYERSRKLKAQNKWYWCPAGGESMATGVRLRFEDILDTTHREVPGGRLLAVTHGNMIDVANAVLQRMSPREFLAYGKDESRYLNNCQILHYTRQDPASGAIADQLRWYRSICPWDETKSWNDGEWMYIPPRKKHSDEELLQEVERYPRLIEQ